MQKEAFLQLRSGDQITWGSGSQALWSKTKHLTLDNSSYFGTPRSEQLRLFVIRQKKKYPSC